jgi:hypothetical protein
MIANLNIQGPSEMLVSKKYSPDDIITLKIMNGDELIARVVLDDVSTIQITRPMAIVPTTQGIGLAPAMYSVEPSNVLTVMKLHIMLHSKTADKLADQYRELTTGIQTVRKSGILV